MEKIAVLTCTENDGNVVFTRIFTAHKKAVLALNEESEKFKLCLMEDVPAEHITVERNLAEKAVISWVEDDYRYTYTYVITEVLVE